MLKSQPVHCQTVRHSQTSLTHSPIHSLFLFIPSFLPSLSVSLISPRASKWGPPLSLRCLQTEGEAKVCNSSKLFVKREGTICSVGGLVASYSCRDSLFLLLCHHRKPGLIKSELCSSPVAGTSNFCWETMPTMLLCQRGQYLCGFSEKRLGIEAMG